MCRENPGWLKLKRKIQTLEKTSAFMIRSRWILSRIRNVSIKYTGNKKQISCITQIRSTLRVLRLLPWREMRTALFCVVMQPVVVISYRRFGTTYRSRRQGSRIQKESRVSQQGVYKWKRGQLFLCIVVPANRVDAHLGRSSCVCPDDVGRLSRMLAKHMACVGLLSTKISSLLRPTKDDLWLRTPGVYSILLSVVSCT